MTLKVCAGGILLRGHKILLGKRSSKSKFHPGVWDIVGGHCRKDETSERTLSRELREEVGVTPTRFSRIAVLHESEPHILESYEYHVYLVTDWIGQPRNLSPNEHSRLEWFQIDEAVDLDLAHPKYPGLFRSIRKSIEPK